MSEVSEGGGGREGVAQRVLEESGRLRETFLVFWCFQPSYLPLLSIEIATFN